MARAELGFFVSFICTCICICVCICVCIWICVCACGKGGPLFCKLHLKRGFVHEKEADALYGSMLKVGCLTMHLVFVLVFNLYLSYICICLTFVFVLYLYLSFDLCFKWQYACVYT